MSAASDPPLPASPPKLSRYRTLRGRNAPASRRLVAPTPASPVPVAQPSTAHASAAVPPPQPPAAQPSATSARFPTPLVPLIPISPLSANDSELVLAEQKQKDLERLQRELDHHEAAKQRQQQQQQQQYNPPKSQSPAREKRSFFSRRRGLSVSAVTANASSPSPTSSAGSNQAVEPPLPMVFRPAVSSVDAPSSAPGEADRTVTIRYRQYTATLPVLVDMTVADVLHACAEKPFFHAPGYEVDPATSALVESYARIGLERRLRRYERVRDIVDSWDSDADNALVVVVGDEEAENEGGTPAGIGRNGHAADLDLASVARSRARKKTAATSGGPPPPPPAGFALLPVYHSQKPGRWHKRYVTLVEATGQLLASNKAHDARVLAMLDRAAGSGGDGRAASAGATAAAPSSSGLQSLCHLSDYDICTPTPTQIRKRLRPPAKTICFAVRSQHRTTMFVNTDNYVHMFAVADPASARAFYTGVFAWRSWYLVHRKLALGDDGGGGGGGEKKSYPPISSASTAGGLHRSLSRRSTATDGASLSRERPPSSKDTTVAAAATTQATFRSPSAGEHAARYRHQPATVASKSLPPDDEEDIPLGLQFPNFQQQQLQQQQQQRTMLSRPSLYASARKKPPPPPQPQPLPTAAIRPAPRLPTPLIDLTPTFQEPPQWSRDGRGHGVRAPPGTAHLVDLATGQATGPAPAAHTTFLRRPDPPSAAGVAVVSSASSLSSSSAGRRTQTMTAAGASAAAAATATAMAVLPRSQSQGPHRHHLRQQHQQQHDGPGQPSAPLPLLSRIPPSS